MMHTMRLTSYENFGNAEANIPVDNIHKLNLSLSPFFGLKTEQVDEIEFNGKTYKLQEVTQASG